MEKGQYTREEILSQTDAWMGALREVEKNKEEIKKITSENYQQIVFTGCGSTYYLSLAAASLFQSQTGLICKAVPASEILLNADTVLTDKPALLFAISRSASTSETVKAVNRFKSEYKGKVISISNYDHQPLTEVSDLAICIPEGQENSVAQTRSFCSMLVAATAITMIAAGKDELFNNMSRLPEIGQNLIKKYHDFAKKIGENLDYEQFYFLGNGMRYGIASEVNLKMKEMTLTYSEPFHFLEFRHGPKSMVNEKTVIFGLLSESSRGYEEKVLSEMKELGARVISLAESDGDISFDSSLDESIRTVLYLPIIQIVAFYRSLKKGLNPDKPRNLSSVIYLE